MPFGLRGYVRAPPRAQGEASVRLQPVQMPFEARDRRHVHRGPFGSLLDERQRRLFAGLESLTCRWAATRASPPSSASPRPRPPPAAGNSSTAMSTSTRCGPPRLHREVVAHQVQPATWPLQPARLAGDGGPLPRRPRRNGTRLNTACSARSAKLDGPTPRQLRDHPEVPAHHTAPPPVCGSRAHLARKTSKTGRQGHWRPNARDAHHTARRHAEMGLHHRTHVAKRTSRCGRPSSEARQHWSQATSGRRERHRDSHVSAIGVRKLDSPHRRPHDLCDFSTITSTTRGRERDSDATSHAKAEYALQVVLQVPNVLYLRSDAQIAQLRGLNCQPPVNSFRILKDLVVAQKIITEPLLVSNSRAQRQRRAIAPNGGVTCTSTVDSNIRRCSRGSPVSHPVSV